METLTRHSVSSVGETIDLASGSLSLGVIISGSEGHPHPTPYEGRRGGGGSANRVNLTGYRNSNNLPAEISEAIYGEAEKPSFNATESVTTQGAKK